MSDRELPPDIVSGTIPSDPGAGDTALRALIPPYRLGEVLLRLAEQKLTGRLALASDMGRRTIHVLRGFPVFIESTLFGERLGAIAVRYGLCGREDVARALSHARDSGGGLGNSLLELGYLEPPQLLALLGVQLREGVAAACSSAPQRARFQHGTTALREIVVLRLHPMTAVLSAVTGLPAAEQTKLVRAVGTQRVLAGAVPALAREWLADLGYLGDVERLCEGDPTVDMVKSRLLARHRPGAERGFDSDANAFSLAGARGGNGRATPAATTDLVALCLLLSGSIKLAGGAARTRAGAGGEHLANTADGVQAALDQAFEQPIATRSSIPTPAPEGALERALDEYLIAKRERGLAGAAAVWGPSVEAADPSLRGELLELYLTLKSEKRAPIVLDVHASAAPEQVMQAYARRTAWISSIVRGDASAHTKLRAAELAQCFDDALERMVPSGAAPPPASTVGVSIKPDTDPAPTTSMRARRDPTPLPRGRTSVPSPRVSAAPAASTIEPAAAAPQAAPSLVPEALVSKIESLLRAGNWQGVLDSLDPNTPDSALPFTVRLARAMASRELAARKRRSVWPLILIFVLGVALGAAARPLAQAFGVDF